jgi:hypothetical protein
MYVGSCGWITFHTTRCLLGAPFELEDGSDIEVWLQEFRVLLFEVAEGEPCEPRQYSK